MKRTLIKCGWLVSMDAKLGDITNAEILVEGDRIVAVGRDLRATSDAVIDGSDMLAMPGLVNAHMHTWETGLRSLGSEWAGSAYYRHMHGNLTTRYRAEDNFCATLIGALGQINNGVTTLFDWCHNLTALEMAERSVDALEESGIRAVFAHGTSKPPTAEGAVPYGEVPHPRARIEALRKGRFAANDRLVTLAMAILGPEQSTPEVTLHDFRLARELGLISTAHVFSPRGDRDQEDGYQKLAAAGLLGPDHNIVHGNYLSDDDLKLLVDHGVSVTATVLVEVRGRAPAPLTNRLRALGAMPSLGIDTEPTVSGDMFNEMRAALIDARRTQHQANAANGVPSQPVQQIKTREALAWATIGGARALQMEDKIGSIAPGKKADIVMLNARDLALYPVHDPVYSIVDQANGGHVDTVMVGGVVRKAGGKLLFPEARIRQQQDALKVSAERVIAAGNYKAVAA